MRSILIGLSLVLVAAGVLAAPVYYMYCAHFSGKSVGKFQVSERSSSWPLPGGITLRFGGNSALKPFSLDLDPAMNPVSFIWSGRIVRHIGHGSPSNQYKGLLYLGENRVMNESFSISVNSDDAKTSESVQWVSIGKTTVPSAGKYHFVLEEGANPQLTVTGIQIEVRRNVMVANVTVILSGVGLLIGGIVLFFTLGRGSGNNENPQIPA